jgi:hypothetical protein
MWKRLFLSFVLFSFFALPSHAQGVGDSLIVNLKNGQRVAIPLSDIRKITFDTLTASVGRRFQPDLPGGLQISPSYPDPAHNGTSIVFSIAEEGSVTISISNSTGDEVRRIVSPTAQAGQNQILWDGLDFRGARVPSGAYYYEVRFKGEVQGKEMVVVR